MGKEIFLPIISIRFTNVEELTRNLLNMFILLIYHFFKT